MIIMHEFACCFPVKSQNYFTAEAPCNPLLNLPFKVSFTVINTHVINEIRIQNMQL